MLQVPSSWEPACTDTGPVHRYFTDHCIARPAVCQKGAHVEHKGTATAFSTLLCSLFCLLFWRRWRPRPATGSNQIQGLSPRSYVTRHRPRLKFRAHDADRSDTAAGWIEFIHARGSSRRRSRPPGSNPGATSL